MPDAVEALAVALLLRRDDTYAAHDPSGRHREDRDAAVVLNLVRGISPYWHIIYGSS